MKSNARDTSSIQHETEHGCNPKIRRPYSRMTIAPIMVEIETHILAGSVVDNSVITSVGQELAPSNDFFSDFDSKTEKTFSQEWELGF